MPNDKGYDEEQGRPIGKWGYIYHIGMGLLFLTATILFLSGYGQS